MFDNLDPVETSYLGVAQVPLLTLSEGAAISGRFQLTEVCVCACIETCGLNVKHSDHIHLALHSTPFWFTQTCMHTYMHTHTHTHTSLQAVMQEQ